MRVKDITVPRTYKRRKRERIVFTNGSTIAFVGKCQTNEHQGSPSQDQQTKQEQEKKQQN